MLNLRYRPIWIAASVVLVLGVVWGSLQTALGGASAAGLRQGRAFRHLHVPRRVVHRVSLPRHAGGWSRSALLGPRPAMEVGQYLMQAGRTADVYDMAANTAGVRPGCCWPRVLTGGWAQRVESWLR